MILIKDDTMEKIFELAKQPSTYRGIIGILTGFGIALSPDMAEAIIAFAVAGFGLIEVVRNERAE